MPTLPFPQHNAVRGLGLRVEESLSGIRQSKPLSAKKRREDEDGDEVSIGRSPHKY